MGDRRIRVTQNRLSGGGGAQFRRGLPGTQLGRCIRCEQVEKHLPLDLSLISGYLDPKARWESERERDARHRGHIGEAMGEAEKVRSGDLGNAYVETFTRALSAVEYVIEKAKAEGQLEVILTAAKVAAEIGKMQAAIADAVPLRGRGRPTKEDVAERTSPDIRDEDFDAAIEDYTATK